MDSVINAGKIQQDNVLKRNIWYIILVFIWSNYIYIYMYMKLKCRVYSIPNVEYQMVLTTDDFLEHDYFDPSFMILKSQSILTSVG